MLDTGASDNFISASAFSKLSKRAVIKSRHIDEVATLANGSGYKLKRKALLRWKVGHVQCKSFFYVMKDMSHDVILGRTFFDLTNANIDFASKTLTLSTPIKARTIQAVVLPPNSESILSLLTDGDISDGTEVIVKPIYENDEGTMWTAHTLSTIQDKKVLVQILNTTNRPRTIKTDTVLAMVDIATDIKMKGEKNTHEEEVFNLDNSALSGENKSNFLEMLHRNRWAFATDISELGHCKDLPMKIEIEPGNTPPTTRPYRASPKIQGIIDEQIKEMLDAGVIEESDSPYSSPIVMVKKRSGSYRMCIDFRKINAISIKRPFPLRTREHLFNLVACQKPVIFTSLDMLSGYWQLEMDQHSKQYTAFATQNNTYAFRRMPMGLTSAGWHFSRVISQILKGLDPLIAATYLDDCLIFSASHEQHIQDVETVITRLADRGLRLNPKKCDFAVEECHFLGHILTPQGVKPQQRLLDKIQDFPRPTNVRGVRRFLGLIQYYAAFVPNMSEMTKHLHKFTKKGARFHWDANAEDNFSKLKKLLVTPPILIHVDYSKQIYLLTDASDDTIGAALCHKIEDKYRPIAFYTAKMNGAQRNYSISEKEALAMYIALKHFEPTIEGYHISIITDHAPLVHIFDAPHKAPSPRLKRWALYMQSFSYEIQYHEGKTHYLADYVSRLDTDIILPENDDPDLGIDCLFPQDDHTFQNAAVTRSKVAQKPRPVDPKQDDKKRPAKTIPKPPKVNVEPQPQVMTPPDTNYFQDLDRAGIAKHQSEDEFCSDIIAYLKHKHLPQDPVREKLTLTYADHMAIVNDILVFYPTFKKKGSKYVELEGKVVIPDSLQTKIVALLHDHILVGAHVGRNVLYDKIYAKFWWRRMSHMIADYVRTCDTCTRKKRVAHANHPMQIFDTPPRPFSHIAIDVIGKIKPSKEGHEYILTVICMLTNFCEAIPLKDQTSEDIVDALITHVYTRYGPPIAVHSDNGAPLLSKLTKQVHRRLGIKQTFTSGVNAKANGRVERIQKQLQSVISCYVDTNSENWHKILPFALYSVRTSVTSRLGDSPYRLLYGHAPTLLPVENELQNNQPLPLSATDYLHNLEKRMSIFREMAAEHNNAYTGKMKDKLDSKARPHNFVVGQQVVIYDPKYKMKPLGKFSYMYSMPHEITEIVSDCLVRLKDLNTGRTLKRLTNVNRLRPYYQRQDEATPKQIPAKIDHRDRFQDGQGEVYHPIKRVITSRKRAGKKQYKVHWADGKISWVEDDSISPTDKLKLIK